MEQFPAPHATGTELQVPKLLYHYTSARGLLGMLGHGELWATHCAFLNDSQEYLFVFDLAAQALGVRDPRRLGTHRKLDSLRKHSPIYEQIAAAIDARLNKGAPNIFAASFTPHGNDLSLWRGYTRPGDAYSIAFDTATLTEKAHQDGWSLAPVTYGTDVADWVNGLIDSLVRRAGANKDSADDQAQLLASRWIDHLTKHAPLMKHGSFMAEQEWRLVREERDGTHAVWEFREGTSSLIPYVKFRFAIDRMDSAAVHAICGPTSDQSLATKALGLFASSRLNTVSHGVSPGDGSYRAW
ncbi:DUF2971 domain-containing protein [Nocardioides zeicaulis]|uniref:DUF2971 domain-containing protein n=1 Tax=Nocardioides zeicaulis TaxID=1776857 RepID=A0ABV6DWS6_9ACTN